MGGFLMFGVLNVKYLTFDTPDENALIGRSTNDYPYEAH